MLRITAFLVVWSLCAHRGSPTHARAGCADRREKSRLREKKGRCLVDGPIKLHACHHGAWMIWSVKRKPASGNPRRSEATRCADWQLFENEYSSLRDTYAKQKK